MDSLLLLTHLPLDFFGTAPNSALSISALSMSALSTSALWATLDSSPATWLQVIGTQLWQVTLAVLIVGLISLRWGRRFPHVVYVLWLLVVIKTVVPPVWSSPASLFSWLDTAAAGWQSQPLEFASAGTSRLDTRVGSIATNASTGETAMAVTGAPASAPQPLPATYTPAETTWNHVAPTWLQTWLAMVTEARVLLGLWASGALLLTLGALLQWCRFWRMLRQDSVAAPAWLHELVGDTQQQLKMQRHVRVRINDQGMGPLVYGWLRPTLVLPAELLEGARRSRLQYVLAHELLHARRGDTLFGLLQFLSQLVWWFHPLVWWANRQAHRLCEQCCDEQVIAGLRCRPEEYAHALLDVLELRQRLRVVPAAPAVRSAEVTAGRLQSLLDRKRVFRQRGPRWQWALLLAVGLFILPGARQLGDWQLPAAEGDTVASAGAVVDGRMMTKRLLLRKVAEEAFAEAEWISAAEKYERLVSLVPDDSEAWFRLGYARHTLGRWEAALQAFETAAADPKTYPHATYQSACALARLERHEQAIEKLRESVQAGHRSRCPIAEHPDLAALQELPEFRQLVRASRALSPVNSNHPLEFWLGTWDVLDSSNTRVGTSRIQWIAASGQLHETCRGSAIAAKQRVSFFDPSRERWVLLSTHGQNQPVRYQLTNSLEATEWVEQSFDASAVLETKAQAEASETIRRLSVQPLSEHAVRVRIEQRTPAAATWRLESEWLYLRRINYTYQHTTVPQPESDQRDL